MATIENLGATFIRHLGKPAGIDRPAQETARLEVKHAAAKAVAHAVQSSNAERRVEEAEHRETSLRRGRASEKAQQFQRMSLDELAEMLRKVNLTFDLFEIQARYSVDRKTGDVSVEVINQRTGEVIRKIPPYDVGQMIESLDSGFSILTDVKV